MRKVDKIIITMDATSREKQILRRNQKEMPEIKTPEVKSFTDGLSVGLPQRKPQWVWRCVSETFSSSKEQKKTAYRGEPSILKWWNNDENMICEENIQDWQAIQQAKSKNLREAAPLVSLLPRQKFTVFVTLGPHNLISFRFPRHDIYLLPECHHMFSSFFVAGVFQFWENWFTIGVGKTGNECTVPWLDSCFQ